MPVISTARWESGVVVRYGTTVRDQGDFAIDGDPDALDLARRSVVDLPWVWLRQVHGAEVHRVVAGQEDAVRSRAGDALVTCDPDVVLSVQTADCVPVTFSSDEGVIGVAHAGWRGIEAGVLQATVRAMQDIGATEIHATAGPCVHAECYEFGADDLERLAATIGPEVVGRTTAGDQAFDATAAVSRILGDLDVEVWFVDAHRPVAPSNPSACTSCQAETWYSHRARRESSRMATVIWRDSGMR